jgi:hypothetical protein
MSKTRLEPLLFFDPLELDASSHQGIKQLSNGMNVLLA